jgi:hypothetical protein
MVITGAMRGRRTWIILFLLLGLASIFLLILFQLTKGSIEPTPEMALRNSSLARLGVLNHVLREYLADFGPLPLDNQQIATALLGGNPSNKVYLYSSEYPRNAAGELIDAWGKPFQYKRDGNGIIAELAEPH